MELDRKTVTELGISATVIAVFVGAVYFVSDLYAAPGNETGNGSASPVIQSEGGLALIGTIALFIFLMALVGLYMYRADFEE